MAVLNDREVIQQAYLTHAMMLNGSTRQPALTMSSVVLPAAAAGVVRAVVMLFLLLSISRCQAVVPTLTAI